MKYIYTSKMEKIFGEPAYLQVIRDIMETGEVRKTRNGTTRSKFALKMDFPLKDGIPLLTTKKVFWKGVVEELLWFLRGDTDSLLLREKGVNIWNGNSTRDALDKKGLNNYKGGDCGPIYGYQWRYFGADYCGPQDKTIDYSGQGVDQLAKCLELLREDPMSRRIFMSAWNPVDLDKMCLPPCHVSYQFYVDFTEPSCGRLCCLMNQRSADLFLGVPFNIASVALLTHILAKLAGLDVGFISLVLGDAHIYEEHWDAVNTQLGRTPILDGVPRLTIVDRGQTNVEDFVAEDFVLEGYKYYPALKGTMKV